MNNNTNDDDYDNMDFYDLFNIEYSDLVFDLYDEINEYSNSPYVDFYNTGDIGKFVNLIFNNIDYENSSVFLNNMMKMRHKEQELDIKRPDKKYKNTI